MRNIYEFLNGFISRAGSYVLSSSIISRGLSFLASWIAIKLIPNKELGAVIYAFQIIAFLIPIAGFGLEQGLLRYGAQLKSTIEKNKLFYYTLKYGVTGSLFFISLVIISSLFIDFKLDKTQFYLMLLSTAFITYFIFGLIKIQCLINKNNKLYSFINLTHSILLVVFTLILSHLFGELGYAICLIIAPLITAFLFINKLNINWNNSKGSDVPNIKFWRYGFFASMSNVTTQLLISIDIILIGSILNNLELVTAFKYISLIPFSLLFLQQAVITTDFVDFTEKINDREFIINYIKNYLKIFSIISLFSILFMYLFGGLILSFFDNSYANYKNILIILTLGVSGILTGRGLFGNLLSSIGKAQVNFITTSIALLLNILLNYFLIPKFGILGAAITSATLMWFTAILSAFAFFYYYSMKFRKVNS